MVSETVGSVGFIGIGTMGSMLIEAFLQAGAFRPENVFIHNRTPQKAQAVAEKHPGVTVAESNAAVAVHAELLFLCIKPLEFHSVLEEIAPHLTPSKTVVVIASPVQLRHLAERIPSKLIKFIPSLTNLAHSGACLLTFHPRISADERAQWLQLFASIGTPVEITETYTRIASDLSSCGPAFLSLILTQMVDAATEETGLPRPLAEKLAIQMLGGTAQLLLEEGLSLEEIQRRIAVPGGITQQGLHLLADQMAGVFHRLFRTTQAKFVEDVEKIESAFGLQSPGENPVWHPDV